jgi:hypothetical protein
MTFSSLHPRALPLYTAFGLSAWWPLLYLDGGPADLPLPSGLAVASASPDAVARIERGWTGVDRAADYAAYAGRPGATTLAVTRDDEPLAVGAAGGAGRDFALERLTLAPALLDALARDAVVAAVGRLARDRAIGARVPSPHPAAAALLAAGWRVTTYDLWMATDRDLVDPTRALPSPALA